MPKHVPTKFRTCTMGAVSPLGDPLPGVQTTSTPERPHSAGSVNETLSRARETGGGGIGNGHKTWEEKVQKTELNLVTLLPKAALIASAKLNAFLSALQGPRQQWLPSRLARNGSGRDRDHSEMPRHTHSNDARRKRKDSNQCWRGRREIRTLGLGWGGRCGKRDGGSTKN